LGEAGANVQPWGLLVVYAEGNDDGARMLIIGAHDGDLRLSCDECGAHAIRPSWILFDAARCEVCGVIGEIHGPRQRISDTRRAPLRVESARAGFSRHG
jgi:hypothetical protein